MATRMQQRRGTAEQWTTANPILNAGEIGFESDTNKFKIGDGTNTWSALDYFIDETALGTTLGDYVETSLLGQALGVATLNASGKLESSQVPNIDELAQDAVDAALTAGTGITKTYNDNANTITVAIDSTVTTNTGTQTLTNKSIDLANNTVTGTLSQFNAAVSDADLASLAGSETLTNKSINLANNTVSGTVAEFNSALSDANFITSTDTGTVTSTIIANETIVDGDISNTAAIAWTKIATSSSVSETELGYLDGVTSNVQSQLDSKAALAGAAFTGNVSTTGNLTVDGNFTVNGGNVLVSATQIQIEDSILQLAHENASNTVDLGLVAGYNDGTAKHAGLVKDATDAKWKLFKGVTTEPSTTVDFSEATLDDLVVGGLEATTLTLGNVTNTEFGYLDGVTSGIQSQIDGKISSSSTDTLTNKTIDFANNTVSGTLAQFNTAVSDADLASIAGTETLTNKTLTSPVINTGTLNQAVNVAGEERWNIVASAATGTINLDLNTAGVWYYTSNATANHTLNFRGSSEATLNSILATGDSISAVWLNTNGTTPYYPTTIQVDGVTQTVKWQNATAPSAGNASSIDAYAFTIVKTASATYTVLGSSTRFA